MKNCSPMLTPATAALGEGRSAAGVHAEEPRVQVSVEDRWDDDMMPPPSPYPPLTMNTCTHVIILSFFYNENVDLYVLPQSKLCTHHLPIMDIVSAGVTVSPGGEVCQSGHRALEVVLLHPGESWVATGGATCDDDGVIKMNGACAPVIIA